MAPAAEVEREVHLVASAIGRAGMTGLTQRQLSALTDLSTEAVAKALESLAASKAIARYGRGLWVLERFAGGNPPPPSFRGPERFAAEFAADHGLRIGRFHGEIRFNPNEKRPVHRWWPYVQGFSAGFVEAICRRFGIGRGSVVLDPFCGSGTVPVVARQLGAFGIGVDRMPIAAFVASAKCEWDADPELFAREAEVAVLDRSPPTLARPFLRETGRQFRPAVLRSLLRLKQNVWSLPEGPERTLAKLAFASILIGCSNLRRTPCLGYVRKRGLSAETPFERFRKAAERIREDLRRLQEERAQWGPKPRIDLGSAAAVDLGEETVDLAITSPPYVNGMDYVMNYKIDLAWMGFIRSYEELAALRAAMVACDNLPRGAVADYEPSALLRSDPWVAALTQAIDEQIATKGTYRRRDMGAIVAKYFDDLAPVIRNVHRALRPGGRFVVVNGDSLIAATYIPGDLIFARLAVRCGFAVESFAWARNRRSGQRRGFRLRESVLTLRKPGPSARPRSEGSDALAGGLRPALRRA